MHDVCHINLLQFKWLLYISHESVRSCRSLVLFNDHKISAADGLRELCVTFKKLLVMKYFSVTPLLKFSAVFFLPFQATSKTEIRNFLAATDLLKKLEKTIKILQLQNAASPIKSRFFNYCRKEENGTDNSSLPGLSNFPTFDWDQLAKIRQHD